MSPLCSNGAVAVTALVVTGLLYCGSRPSPPAAPTSADAREILARAVVVDSGVESQPVRQPGESDSAEHVAVPLDQYHELMRDAMALTPHEGYLFPSTQALHDNIEARVVVMWRADTALARGRITGAERDTIVMMLRRRSPQH